MTAIAEARSNQIAELRYQLETMAKQFEAVLPQHIPVQRFVRVVVTAIQNNPDLLNADRRSLFNSAMKAAEDGLLPDGRDGAMVCFKDKRRGLVAQWMPMIGGLRKKVRQSGEIATWETHVVHQRDRFRYRLGDDPMIEHEPALDDPGPLIAAYSIARLKSGELSREIMSRAQIEDVRAHSRASAQGPWTTWYEEMARKTVARRHAKVLPMSTDLEDVVHRDDALFDKEERDEKREEAAEMLEQRPDLAARMKTLAQIPPAQASSEPLDAPPQDVDFDADTGELDIEDVSPDPNDADYQRGVSDAKHGLKSCLNIEIRQDAARLERWRAGWHSVVDGEAAQVHDTLEEKSDHGRLKP
jgi:recombination protein RecT